MSGNQVPANPYVIGVPLTGETGFYGREDVFDFIEDILETEQQNVVVFYGQRRVGKTSLLFQIARRIKQKGAVVPVYFDLQGKEQKSLSEVLYDLSRTVARSLKIEFPKQDRFDDTGRYFRNEFLLSVNKRLGNKRLLLLFDEFDVLGDGISKTGAASETLLPYLQNLIMHQRQIVFVFVVGRRIEELTTHFHSIFKQAAYRQIGLLTENNARNLIVEPVKDFLTYEDSAIEAILNLTSGHPYFTQLICFESFNDAKKNAKRVVSKADIYNLIDQTIESGHGALNWFWDGLPRAERFIMAAVAHVSDKSGMASQEDIRRILEKHKIILTGLELTDAPGRLVDWDMLRRKPDSDNYYCVIELVRRWILKYHPLEGARRDVDLISKRATRLYENARDAHADGDDKAMPKIFICYRREDSEWPAQRIYDELVDHFGSESVVFDIETIPLGTDFREYLNKEVSRCDIFLAVIDDSWLEILKQRLDEPNDFVRIEIQAALERKVPVVPILVGKKSVPSEKDLPPELADLPYKQAAEVRAGADLQSHLKRLVNGLERLFSESKVGKYYTQKQVDKAIEREELTTKYTNSIGMEFVLIRAGAFMMGSSKADRFNEEKPQHKVTISHSYYLQTTPVSQGVWKRIMGDNPSEFKDCGEDCPVENISWFDTQDFIRKLNLKERTDKYRLPTEAEWEYACRAGTGTEFSFGDDADKLNDYAWYDANSKGKTHPVGQKKPNSWGLYDMHGNVCEWCQDWYGDYPSNSVVNPKGPGDGISRVLRGGSWHNRAGNIRSAGRSWGHPATSFEDGGFRVVRDF